MAHTEDSDAAELTGYPVSVHGGLVRGRDQPLFSLYSLADIHQAFPHIWSEPTAEEITESWMAFAMLNMLPECERAGVRYFEGRMEVLLTGDLVDCWSAFAALAIQGRLYWYVPVGPLYRLCSVTVEGADSLAAVQLQALHIILRLEQDPNRAEIVRTIQSLHDWLASRELRDHGSPRGLADLAFRYGRVPGSPTRSGNWRT